MTLAAHHLWSYPDYIAFEAEQPVKHEWLDGGVYAMTGGSIAHAAATAAVSGQLFAQLHRQSGCRVFSSDLRIRTTSGLATYPDASVICGPVKVDPEDPKGHTALNPVLICEVLSPSTEAYDRGEKFEHYKTIESLIEYILVDPKRQTLDRFYRTPLGWGHASMRAEGTIRLACGPLLDLEAIFDLPESP